MKMIPLGPNLIIKVDMGEKKSTGGIIIPGVTREAQAPEKVEIVAMGESAFDDLKEENRPKVGDLAVIAKYDGIAIQPSIEGDQDFEFRTIADTRIRCLLREEE